MQLYSIAMCWVVWLVYDIYTFFLVYYTPPRTTLVPHFTCKGIIIAFPRVFNLSPPPPRLGHIKITQAFSKDVFRKLSIHY